jgi:alkanesulfonate monooxygenase SsuD/methylene tetrahydromethanopterin reductase-like flavin-dependent oxidoreductase (luciferase family)
LRHAKAPQNRIALERHVAEHERGHSSMVKVGVVNVLRSCKEEIRIAQACEAAGCWGIGLGDTAPSLYQDTYVTASACLTATKQLHVGPMVTNTVARHWSTLAATARSFEELAPGRFLAGVGTGDGAVHSVGLKPARWSEVERDVQLALEMAKTGFELHIAASGPRGAEAAGRVASDFVVGTGLEPTAICLLADRARKARSDAGVGDPLRTWAFVNTVFVDDEASEARARRDMRGGANAYARFAFASTFQDKAVPDHWQQPIRERLARYDFTHHIRPGEVNPNNLLLDDMPEIQDYLLDRMLLIGTPEACADRLNNVISASGIDGVWLAITPSLIWPDPADLVVRVGEAFRSLIASDSVSLSSVERDGSGHGE